ncbi:hypothetical protein RRF57_009836 [Xylaria bambusicola]|uniref:Uncharacterized protein n=1 Tax=Xylaria bambusicola TaxID=326684 RepID=A0AAN7URJ3_9PEZI
MVAENTLPFRPSGNHSKATPTDAGDDLTRTAGSNTNDVAGSEVSVNTAEATIRETREARLAHLRKDTADIYQRWDKAKIDFFSHWGRELTTLFNRWQKDMPPDQAQRLRWEITIL